MKKTTVLLFILLISKAYSQIGTRELPSSTPTTPAPVVFDSLDGLIRDSEWQQYIGQELFFLPKHVTSEAKSTYDAGYSNLYTKLQKGYKFQGAANTYKPVMNADKAKSSYNAVAGKYFKILEIIDKTEISYFDGGGLYVKLEEKDSKDIAYLEIIRYKDMTQNLYAEHIIAGTFIKLQQRYLNQTFYVKSSPNYSIKDIKTGERKYPIEGEELQCTDVTLIPYSENGVYHPALIFKDKDGKEFSYEMDLDINMYQLAKRFTSKTEKIQLAKEQVSRDSIKAVRDKEFKAQSAKDYAVAKANYIKKYGEKLGTLVADEKVVVGMTKAMCIDAWGQPSDINSTTAAYGTHEQYVYRGKNAYLYFENGKLVTIQK